MKISSAVLVLILPLLVAVLAATTPGPDHRLFGAVLAAHVHDGRVDYRTLKTDPRLSEYLAQLAVTDPSALASDQERLALWLNAYNAYTLQLIIEHQPVKSIVEIGRGGLVLGSLLKTTAWDKPWATVGGQKFTLNQIEHEVIRARFRDARTHFALNCASGSCPVLRPEAYEADKLEAQLDQQAREFLRDSSKNHFDPATKTATLSSIFKWYGRDFGANDREALLAAAKYAPEPIRRQIESDPAAWKIRFMAYDWSLNDRRAPANPGSSP